MTDPTRDTPDYEPPELSDTSSVETAQAAKTHDGSLPSYDARAAQLEALRSDVNKLRIELAALAASSTRLVVLEANAAKQMAENRIRHHLFPVLIAAGVVGYVWSAFLRPR